MKIMNIVVTAVVSSGFLFSGVLPANATDSSVKDNEVNSFEQQSDYVSPDDSIIVVDGVSGDVKTLANSSFSSLEKTEPNPYISSNNFYVDASSTTRPVGVKTSVRVNNILYGHNRKMEVQQYVSAKKKWVKVASKTTPKGQNNGWNGMQTTVNIPGFTTKSKGGKVSYRIYFPKTKSYTSYKSKTMKLNYVNPRFYKGYKKTIYNDIKKSDMCPNVIIDTGYIGKNVAGRAWFGTYKMKVANGFKGKYRQRVSVHECAHLKSGVSYKENISNLKKESNKLFKLNKNSSKGIEYLADCMSFAKMGKTYIPGYKKSCSSYQIKKAKRVWAGKEIY